MTRLARLLLLTDRHQLPAGRSLHQTVRDCAEAGLTTVVLRELDLPLSERADLATSLARHVAVISAHTLLPFATGIHLAWHQQPSALPHGRSCHDAQEVISAVSGGAAYVSISPVAVSRSKPGHGPAIGAEGVRRAVAAAGPVPVFALGGVTIGNTADWRSAGAHGVAVMGEVMRADHPAAVVAGLLEAVA